MKTENTKKPGRLSYVALLLLLCGALFFSFGSYDLQADEQAEQEMESENTHVSALTTRLEKLSYALGMDFGSRLRSESIVIDEDIFQLGLEAALSGSPTLLIEKEAREILLELRDELNQKRQAPSLAEPTQDSADIHVSFKLDTRLTRGMYMGNRWVSPQTYTRVGEGEEKEISVETKAVVLDAQGRAIGGSLAWEAADPDMISILPAQGDAVSIIVKRPGQSSLKITSDKIVRVLTVSAVAKGETLQLEISQ